MEDMGNQCEECSRLSYYAGSLLYLFTRSTTKSLEQYKLWCYLPTIRRDNQFNMLSVFDVLALSLKSPDQPS